MERRAAVVIAVTVIAAGAARANVGPPAYGGQLVREPTGLEHVTITRETLTVDLRPLADAGPSDALPAVRVEAVYRLDNAGPERALDLRFAAGSDARQFEVRLDDQVVPSGPAADGEKGPPSWGPPATTPGIDGGTLDYLHYGRTPTTLRAFRVTLPPGRHTLAARYDAEVARHHTGRPTVSWQLAYVLRRPAPGPGSAGWT